MPSGPPELHKFWSEYYTDWADDRMLGSGDFNACRYLREQGFKEARFQWYHPTYKSYDDMTQLEYDAIYYLIHEWDYGGFKGN